MNCVDVQITKMIDELLSYKKLVEFHTGEKNMPNIKITAEVNGTQVPLHTVSTETFEAIKALEKPKEIPVARLATQFGRSRLLFKPSKLLSFLPGRIYALDLKTGDIELNWGLELDTDVIRDQMYTGIKPL